MDIDHTGMEEMMQGTSRLHDSPTVFISSFGPGADTVD